MGFMKRFFGKKEAAPSPAPVHIEPDGLPEDLEWKDERVSAFDGIDEPRASFTVTDFADDRIRVEFDWNRAFINKVHELGFVGETEEDTVQMFFYASSMRPTGIPSETQDLTAPEVRLTHDANRLVA